MGTKLGRILRRLLFLLMIGAVCFMGWQQGEIGRRFGQRTNQGVEVGLQNETEAKSEEASQGDSDRSGEYKSPVDFESLREINPDIVAWLTIPGTYIDYPVVQAKDNETYLTKDFEGKQSKAGAIFLDCDSDSDLRGFHSILYGHHMRDGSMFAQLVNFKDREFFEKNREIILYLPEEELHLRTIAAVYGDDSGEKRRTKFSDQERFNSYVDEMTRNCGFRELPEGDCGGLYSFVTCSYEFENARTIVYAVREETD